MSASVKVAVVHGVEGGHIVDLCAIINSELCI
jgi:hypothetical protein